MTGRVITIAQRKGGAGKTTMTAHLAVAAAEAGLKVLAIDIDPQGSLAAWGALRAIAAPPLEIGVESVAGHRVRDVAERRRNEFDLILVDAPPHADTETRHALRAADLALAPTQPSPLDLWAARAVVDAAHAARTDLALVLNKTPARARIVDEAVAAAADLGAPLLTSRLGARVAFARSMGVGLTAIDQAPRGPAAVETRALLTEALRRA